jgi:hypothetical protein
MGVMARTRSSRRTQGGNGAAEPEIDFRGSGVGTRTLNLAVNSVAAASSADLGPCLLGFAAVRQVVGPCVGSVVSCVVSRRPDVPHGLHQLLYPPRRSARRRGSSSLSGK